MSDHQLSAIVLADALNDRYEESSQDVGRFNLAVFGPSGVGKSTLINAIFGYDIAETGVGEPVTKESRLYFHDDGQFGLLDTQGLELADTLDEILDSLRAMIGDLRSRPIEDQVHVAWYCIAGSGRFQETDERFVHALRELDLPVVFVMTKVPNSDGVPDENAMVLADVIAGAGLDVVTDRPVLTNALGDAWTDDSVFGLEDLLIVTREAAPDGLESAVAAAQKLDLEMKHEAASAAILKALDQIHTSGISRAPIMQTWGHLLSEISIIYGVRKEASAQVLSRAIESLEEEGIIQFGSEATDPLRFGAGAAGAAGAAGVAGAAAAGAVIGAIPFVVLLGVPILLGMWKRDQDSQRRQEGVVRLFTEMLGSSWEVTCLMWAQAHEGAGFVTRTDEDAMVRDFVTSFTEAARGFVHDQKERE